MPPPWRSRTDGALLKNARQDVDAFGELYERYEPIVAAFLMRRVGAPELTADLTSETFATALISARNFRDDGTPAVGWLLGIARNTMLRSLERGGAERRALRKLGVERSELSDASLERVEALIDADRPDNPLLTALERLPQAQRDAVRAHVIDDEPYDELAKALGIPEATVRQRVSRGVKALRTTIEGRN